MREDCFPNPDWPCLSVTYCPKCVKSHTDHIKSQVLIFVTWGRQKQVVTSLLANSWLIYLQLIRSNVRIHLESCPPSTRQSNTHSPFSSVFGLHQLPRETSGSSAWVFQSFSFENSCLLQLEVMLIRAVMNWWIKTFKLRAGKLKQWAERR